MTTDQGIYRLKTVATSTPVARTIIRHRWLIFELVRREVKLRYRGTWLGFLWSLLNPLIMTAVYTVVFSFVFKVGIPKYSAFLFCGLLPWNWFAEAVTSGTNCFVDRSTFLRDAIFPSEILPVVAIANSMMNYVFSLPVLLVVLLLFKVTLGWSLFALPIVMTVQFLFTLGIVLLLGTYDVFFRDLRYIVQNVLFAVFFLTPVMYDYSSVPGYFQWIFRLNPLAHIIDGYHSVFFSGTWPDWKDIGLVFVLSILMILLGGLAFRSNRERFAEFL